MAATRDARDGEAAFKQRGHRREAVGRFERLRVAAFVEHDAKSALVFKAHSIVNIVTVSLSLTKTLFPAITGCA